MYTHTRPYIHYIYIYIYTNVMHDLREMISYTRGLSYYARRRKRGWLVPDFLYSKAYDTITYYTILYYTILYYTRLD